MYLTFRAAGFRPGTLCGDGLSPLGAFIALPIWKGSALRAGFFRSFLSLASTRPRGCLPFRLPTLADTA
ncbi:hypothetical protein NDU88_005664 [Pleurodeles waltl]|uniref:Uncharacterized protein n=1 Tax=Pleurodeles waltl TaxID=8319 RepID=A0AAV7NPM5_PLEWA|nr:hypothetical protein NDU88_005664 [Pleurodeles waltl]